MADIAAGAGFPVLSTPAQTASVRKLCEFGRAQRTARRAHVFRSLGQWLLVLPPSTWMLLDITFVSTGVELAFVILPPPELPVTPHVALWQAMPVFAFAVTLASLVFGLYERETIVSRSRVLTRLLLTSALAVLIAYAAIYVVMYSTVSRRITGLTLSAFLLFALTVRLFANWAAHCISRGVLVIGSRGLLESFQDARRHGLLSEYRLLGYASPEPRRVTDPADRAYLGTITDAIATRALPQVTDVVVSAEVARHPAVMRWMVPCLQRGCRVTNEAIFYEKATGQILVDEITPSWFLFADLRGHCEEQATLKRFVDLLLAAIGLILSTPFWPLIALAIKLCDRGPVFYTQSRVGQHGRLFTLYKFRTMRPDAENGRSVWSRPNDPRVTSVGRWLRRTRLDELPQLINVLTGDMSIVGPRPERPDLVQGLSVTIPYYAERHLVKPGITGWAQISFGYGSSEQDAKRKLQFDLYYLKHMSFELDLIILFRTLGTFLRGAC